MRKRFLKILLTLAMPLMTGPYARVAFGSHEWRWFTPSLTSEVRNLPKNEAAALLSEFCQTELTSITRIGMQCTTRSLGSAFSDIIDSTFHPEGVVVGHFLGSQTDDVVISGWSAETHPLRWGGTLLLTRREGKWIPLWYKSALITHSCQKTVLPDGREILLCEDEDGGMGHQLHYLYWVDLESPANLKDSLLVEAETFSDGCDMQRQVMESLQWTPDKKMFSVVIRTLEFIRSPDPICTGFAVRSKRPPDSLLLRFGVTPAGLRKVGNR